MTEAVLLTAFAASTAWLVMSSPTDGPMITPSIRSHFTWYGVRYTARILLAYGVIGAVLGSLVWLVLQAWASVRRRPVTRRWACLGTLAAVLAVLAYKAVASCVLNPQIMSNAFSAAWSVRLIGWIGDWVPGWALVVVRGTSLAALCVLLVAGAAGRIGRMKQGPRLATLVVSSALLVCVAGLGLGLALEQRPAEPRHDSRPNIILLASDGLQQEHLGLYGYPKRTSPTIDRLGAEGTRFTQCYVPVARTLVSWTSMLTGTWPHTHGARYTWPREPQITLRQPTLCQELRKHGYTCRVYSDWAGSDFGKVDYGFDLKEVAPEAWSLSSWIAQTTCRAHPLLLAFADNRLGHLVFPEMRGMPVSPNPDAVTAKAVSALADLAESRQPFFMIVFYSETHLPYATRYPYYRLFADPEYSGCHKVGVYVPDPRVVASGAFDPQKEFDVDQVRALYDGAVRSFDDQVASVVEALRDLNLWDDTIVVVASDHGEDLMESPYSYGHGHYFFGDDYDSRIPLVISDPEIRGRERIIDETTSTIDLMPTLLERVGVDVPATCEGRSFLDLLRGRRPERDGTIFAETGVLMGGSVAIAGLDVMSYPPLLEMFEVTDLASGQVGIKEGYHDLLISARHRMVRTSHWKLIYVPLEEGAYYALYDIRPGADPRCQGDVKELYPDVFADLRDRLWTWMEQDPLRERRGDHLVRRPAGPAI